MTTTWRSLDAATWRIIAVRETPSSWYQWNGARPRRRTAAVAALRASALASEPITAARR
jgi:hypothetical protein